MIEKGWRDEGYNVYPHLYAPVWQNALYTASKREGVKGVEVRGSDTGPAGYGGNMGGLQG